MNSPSPLNRIEQALLLAAYFRGGKLEDQGWTSNTDQILTLSLFYTGEISAEECARRFSVRAYIRELYDSGGELNAEIADRNKALAALLRDRAELIEGSGNLDPKDPADPTYTSCRLTVAGLEYAEPLVGEFPLKPVFENWPDKREAPGVR